MIDLSDSQKDQKSKPSDDAQRKKKTERADDHCFNGRFPTSDLAPTHDQSVEHSNGGPEIPILVEVPQGIPVARVPMMVLH